MKKDKAVKDTKADNIKKVSDKPVGESMIDCKSVIIKLKLIMT